MCAKPWPLHKKHSGYISLNLQYFSDGNSSAKNTGKIKLQTIGKKVGVGE
jgi:hypothetical protein